VVDENGGELLLEAVLSLIVGGADTSAVRLANSAQTAGVGDPSTASLHDPGQPGSLIAGPDPGPVTARISPTTAHDGGHVIVAQGERLFLQRNGAAPAAMASDGGNDGSEVLVNSLSTDAGLTSQ
jgi:hypothetical protein